MRENRHRNRGVAVVEAAICLPLIILLVIGTIESSNAIFLAQSLEVVAYETAQIATAVGGTEANARKRGEELMANFGIHGASISIVPAITASTVARTLVEVKVSASVDDNTLGVSRFFVKKRIEKAVRMVRL